MKPFIHQKESSKDYTFLYLRRLYGRSIKWNDESLFITTVYHLYQFIICHLLSYCSSIHSFTTSETTIIKKRTGKRTVTWKFVGNEGRRKILKVKRKRSNRSARKWSLSSIALVVKLEAFDIVNRRKFRFVMSSFNSANFVFIGNLNWETWRILLRQ